LKDRVDPKGHELDNAVFKYTEQGNVKAYIINAPCTFQRSLKWIEEGVVVVTELDGPRHWGKFMDRTPTDLAQTIRADYKKNGLVLSKKGVFMVRVLYNFGNEVAYVLATLEKIYEVFEYIRQISKTQLTPSDRLIVLDMKQVLEGKQSTDNPMWKAAMKLLKNK